MSGVVVDGQAIWVKCLSCNHQWGMWYPTVDGVRLPTKGEPVPVPCPKCGADTKKE